MGSSRIVSIVGARPQFVKLAPVSRELIRRNKQGATYEDIILHTGQHYDRSMSDVFFDELQIPPVFADLGIGSGRHGAQTGAMLKDIETQLIDINPDVVVIYGDTNSTLAGCLGAAKLHIPLVHVEAGLRSFNRLMPEEINRIVADHTSDLLLAPTPRAMVNLETENLGARARRVGDVMYDAVLHASSRSKTKSTILSDLGLQSNGYGLVTIHRAENTTNEIATSIFGALAEVSQSLPLVFPVHPRTRDFLKTEHKQMPLPDSITMIDPVGYFDMMALLANASVMLTDSGGVQKEAMFLNTPCVTLRQETEWVETVETGANRLAGLTKDGIVGCVRQTQTAGGDSAVNRSKVEEIFGDGNTASRIVDEVDRLIATKSR